MIDVHDLMVGNWIYLFDPEYKEITTERFQISEIREKGIRVEDFTDIYEQEFFAPIPVTVDMLKRIGFEEDTTAGEPWPYWRYWDKDYKYKLDVDEGYTNSGKRWSVHIDNDVCNTIGSGEFTYVHELQNLTRIITGFSIPITQEMIDGKVDK